MIKIKNKLKIYPGLGDALFLYPIARWLISKKILVEVETQFPEIFKKLLNNKLFNISKNLFTNIVDYKTRMNKLETNIFEDVCILSGAPRDLNFSLDYFDQNLLTNCSKYCVLKPPYSKYPRHSFLQPNIEVIQKIINIVNKKMPIFLICHKDDTYNNFKNVTKIQINKIADLLSLIKNSSLVISQTGHAQHIAESFDRPCLVLLSSKMKEKQAPEFVKLMKPEKIIIGKKTKYIFDNINNFEAIYEDLFNRFSQ